MIRLYGRFEAIEDALKRILVINRALRGPDTAINTMPDEGLMRAW